MSASFIDSLPYFGGRGKSHMQSEVPSDRRP
jgi:hypothetical protein